MRPTLAELSARAGCSPATASRVLNNSAFVAVEVRDRVLAAIRETGYTPRARNGARATAPVDRLATVSVVLHRHTPMERVDIRDGHLDLEPAVDVPAEAMLSESRRLSDAFYRHIIDGVVDALGSRHAQALLQANKDLMAPAFVADVNAPDRRGIILIGEYSPDLAAFVACCRRPLVLVDFMQDGWPDVVAIDNRGGMAALVQHLVDLGHRDIGYVGGPLNASLAERRAVCEWELRRAGRSLRPEWCYDGSEQIGAVAAGVTPILKRAKRPTALVCCNDCAALGVLRAAESLGIDVPGQLSVTGFDDIDPAALVKPALTTVRVPMIELGRQAVRLLLTQDPAARGGRGCELRVRTRLVVRESTGRVAEAGGRSTGRAR